MNRPSRSLRSRLHEIIFEADTPEGRLFDLLLMLAILSSVVVVLLESVPSVRAQAGPTLRALEWGFTILFTIEYLLRLATVHRPPALCPEHARHHRSPGYFAELYQPGVPGGQSLLVIRLLRLLRVFRVLKLAEYLRESRTLVQALRSSWRKIAVFLMTVMAIVVVVGTLMYVIEGERHGFTSIPISIYWAVVTLTTVGYGDLAPATTLGRALAVVLMLTGYGIIAVPTGIVTAELSRAMGPSISTQACPACGAGGHDADASYCRRCGTKL